jgi:hypothetical protein
MKVFFSMSFRGDINTGRKIYKILKKLSYKHTSTCFDEEENTPEIFYKFDKQELAEHYKRIFYELLQADVLVEEASIQSVTTGQVIQKAVDNKIPVLVLNTKGNRPFFLDGIECNEKGMLVCEYNENNLASVLKEGIEFLSEELSSRFTLILPNKILKHLDKVAEKRKSRSEYIRELIDKDMKGGK